MVGEAKCIGFIRREDQTCNFKTSATPLEGDNIAFASEPHEDRDAYYKREDHLWNDGTMNQCEYPQDWKVKVISGDADTCQCLSRPVEDKRFTSATWTFDVWSDALPVFISSKPQIHAPCPMANSPDCLGKSDTSLRTSGAGGVP